MPDSTIATAECAINEAAIVQAALAASKCRFFNGTLIPDVTTTKAIMVAAETALVGYPAGGYPMAAFSDPQFVSPGGAAITSPMVPVNYASGSAATLGGGWFEDSTGAVLRVFIFEPQRTLASVGQGFQFVRQLIYGRNP